MKEGGVFHQVFDQAQDAVRSGLFEDFKFVLAGNGSRSQILSDELKRLALAEYSVQLQVVSHDHNAWIASGCCLLQSDPDIAPEVRYPTMSIGLCTDAPYDPTNAAHRAHQPKDKNAKPLETMEDSIYWKVVLVSPVVI